MKSIIKLACMLVGLWVLGLVLVGLCVHANGLCLLYFCLPCSFFFRFLHLARALAHMHPSSAVLKEDLLQLKDGDETEIGERGE